MADNGGLRIAFGAYKEKIKDNLSLRLPSLHAYTDDQLFFISTAQTWCSIETTESRVEELLNSHPPAEFRVSGMLSNFEQFSRSFSCKKNSNMNPLKKCRVW